MVVTLVDIINTSFKTGLISEDLKQTVISPILKRGSKT